MSLTNRQLIKAMRNAEDSFYIHHNYAGAPRATVRVELSRANKARAYYLSVNSANQTGYMLRVDVTNKTFWVRPYEQIAKRSGVDPKSFWQAELDGSFSPMDKAHYRDWGHMRALRDDLLASGFTREPFSA